MKSIRRKEKNGDWRSPRESGYMVVSKVNSFTIPSTERGLISIRRLLVTGEPSELIGGDKIVIGWKLKMYR